MTEHAIAKRFSMARAGAATARASEGRGVRRVRAGVGFTWVFVGAGYAVLGKVAMGVSPTDQVLGFIYIGTAKEIPKERARPELVDVVEFWLD